MLTKEDFIRHILGEAPRTKARVTKKDTGHVEGFDFADDAPDTEAIEDTRFVTPLIQAGFGDGQGIPRATVIRSTDAVARYIPDEVRYWPKTPSRPHHTLLIEANLTHRELLAIPAFKSRQLAHLDIAEDAVARLVAEALEGFQRGAEGLDASALKGPKHETLCVVSIIDEREGHAGRLACFGTFNAKTEGLETFFVSEHARTWDRADARERLGLIYERQFKKLGEASWQEAFTTTDERKQAEKLLAVCTKKNVAEKDMQESILDLLDTIARGFGLRKKTNADRRLRAFPLPGEHDIGIDSEEREKKYGGTNPFSGVTLRDDQSRLLGYIVYPLKTKSDAEKLRQHLEQHNRFHNVLVVYPDANQASIELWQGREQLTGKLRKGQSHKDAADVVNLLSRFFVVSKAKVRNPEELAQELAYRARYLRRLALRQLEDEPEKGPLRNLYNAFRVALVHDQEEDEFADAFAQTITYGLLTARWLGNDQLATTGHRFTRQSALKYVPAASPFLNDLFKSVLSLKLDEQRGRLLWLVDDVADLLDRIDVAYVFGAGDAGSDTATDPVIHFYEPFLAAYDKQLKNKRGVFFTPRPVVSYIVRSVHELLQKEFGLEDGLASTDTWDDVTKRIKGVEIPEGVKASDPFVCVLDPATGTGTFLFECIEVIERTMKDRWCRELKATGWKDPEVVTRWTDYVPKHLLPRLHGYELMIAPYAIAILKLSFRLLETGCPLKGGDRLHVYITNTLEAPSRLANPRLADLFTSLSRQAQEVDEKKRSGCFTVIVGNPPYSVLSANLTEEMRRLVDPYRHVAGDKIQERSMLRLEMHLQDDYVKFLAISQAMIARAKVGVLGLITNNGYLDNLSLRGVRTALLNQMKSAVVTNLLGNRLRPHSQAGAVGDENVFDIEQGVAIFVGVASTQQPSRAAAHVEYIEVLGTRPRKYAQLLSDIGTAIVPLALAPRAPNYFFVPRDETHADEYAAYLSLDTLMPVNISGIVTAHDALVADFKDSHLIENANLLLDSRRSDGEVREAVDVKDNAGWKLQKARVAFRTGHRGHSHYLHDYAYRPFDTRRIYYHPAIVWSDRRNVMSHVLAGNNLALATCRQLAGPPWTHVFVTRHLQDDCFISNRTRERSYHFPLFLHGDQRQRSLVGSSTRLHAAGLNLSPDFIAELGLDSLPTESCSTPRDRALRGFGYVYAVLHSVGYRERYVEFLKVEFPRIPRAGSAALARSLSDLGLKLVRLHLLDVPKEELSSVPEFVGAHRVPVSRVGWGNNTVWIDGPQNSAGFRGVPATVWEFRVGCYRVCEKWLKDRKGRALSQDDIKHYQKIVFAIAETVRIMEEIDEVVTKHGGWPGAFAMKTNAS